MSIKSFGLSVKQFFEVFLEIGAFLTVGFLYLFVILPIAMLTDLLIQNQEPDLTEAEWKKIAWKRGMTL